MPKPHNANCWSCGETYHDYQTGKSGKNLLDVWDEGKKCTACRKANAESKDSRMNKYKWRSLTEIDASWGDVKEGQLWEKAVEKFAKSLPVEEELQNKFIEVFSNA
jgi:hypothetical protein